MNRARIHYCVRCHWRPARGALCDDCFAADTEKAERKAWAASAKKPRARRSTRKNPKEAK